jgi:hypothetical protein
MDGHAYAVRHRRLGFSDLLSALDSIPAIDGLT